MYRIELLDEAKSDIREAKLYYRSFNKRLPAKFQSDLNRVAKKLIENPRIFGFRFGARRLANLQGFPYQVLYKIDRKKVIILAIIHASRDSSFISKRSE